MTLYAYDGAEPFNLAAARRHGGIVATVYIVGEPGGMPHADKARVAEIRARGMGALPNWERAADFFRTASLTDCRNAGAEALAACRALGFPDDGTIGVAFSFDYQVPASGYAWATEQLKACGAGMGGHYRPLGYGQIDLIEYWAAHGLPGPHWLMGSTWRATSDFAGHEVGSPHVALVQAHDAAGRWLTSPVRGTDINTVTRPEQLAAWWPTGSPYAQGGNPLSNLDADDKKWLLDNLGPAEVWGHQLVDPTDGKSVHVAGDFVRYADFYAHQALDKVGAVAAVVNPLTVRVASLQAAVDAVGKAVAALAPAQQVAVDTAAIAASAADAVVAKVKSLVWGVQG